MSTNTAEVVVYPVETSQETERMLRLQEEKTQAFALWQSLLKEHGEKHTHNERSPESLALWFLAFTAGKRHEAAYDKFNSAFAEFVEHREQNK